MQTKTTETVSKEASDNPLTVLSRCLSAMVSDQKTGARQVLIPFMDSDLNFLLKAYFEGRGTVKMIVNFNPSLPCFDESVEVLEFSSILAKEGDKNVQYQISAKKAASGEESGEDESGEEVSGSDECVAEDEADDSEGKKLFELQNRPTRIDFFNVVDKYCIFYVKKNIFEKKLFMKKAFYF